MLDYPKEGGFTLLELVVALAISSILAVAGAAALSTTIDAYRRISQRADERESFRSIDRMLRLEWAGRGRTVLSNGSVLEFETVHAVASGQIPSLSRQSVRYACESDNGRTYRLSHRVEVLPLPTPADPDPPRDAEHAETEVLVEGLRQCAFLFLTFVPNTDGQTRPEWTTSWKPSIEAPAQLQLMLSGGGGSRPARVYQALTRK